jgi:uncharacterized protein with ParB-like and HNH nuclease domain
MGAAVKVWNVLKTTYKVSDFIGWQKDGSLQLNPDFQRRSVWKAGAKSYLIDTIIRGLPIPIIFLRDKRSSLKTFAPLRDVVDGQQRLRTVIAFIAPSLLKDFDQKRDVFTINKVHNKEYQGQSFADLPQEVQTQILDYQFTVNVFSSDTDDREVKQVFTRMNSSGYKLNAQELRNAEFFGAFKSAAEGLATEQYHRWREWKVFNGDNIARMNDVELTSELIILMLNGATEKSEKTVTSYYHRFESDFPEHAEVARRMQHTFNLIANDFGSVLTQTFRKRTLFYALYGAVYCLLYGFGKDGKLSPKRPGKTASIVLTDKAIHAIKEAGEKIATKAAPEPVVRANTKATQHARERAVIINYLLHTAT